MISNYQPEPRRCAELGFELKGRPIVSGTTRGRVLVSTKPLSFLGGVDPETGRVVEKDHDLEGENIKGVILCFPHGHGSTVGSYVLYSAAKNGVGPKAIVNATADPVVVAGAIIAGIPMVDRVDLGEVSNGDFVEVDGDRGTVTVLERGKPCT